MTEINGVDEVIRNMGNIQVRRLPVVNRDKRAYPTDLIKRAARSYRRGIGRNSLADVSAVFRSQG